MIERAFEEARRHNRGAVASFALDRAMDLLRAANIKDPKIVEEKPAKTRVTRSEATTPELTLEAFLEGKRVQTLEIGGNPPQQLEQELDQAGINVFSDARDMMHHESFTTEEATKSIDLVWAQVKDLGLTRGGTTRQIFERVDALPFLERCPAEVGPHLRLLDKDQPLDTWYYTAMNTIPDRSGGPGVFGLERRECGLWLGGGWADPDGGWGPGDRLVFALRKPETLESK